MKWIPLKTEAELQKILERSATTPQLIFKYSSRCAVSDMIKERLEMEETPPAINFHFLDLVRYRSLSDKIAKDLAVYHQSPQVLLIKNGECIFEESHMAIHMEDIVVQSGKDRI
jgi:bacillithiol system protein YtxJ